MVRRDGFSVLRGMLVVVFLLLGMHLPGGAGQMEAAAAGSDFFGYTVGPDWSFQWIDATVGTNTGLKQPGITGAIPLPFTFPFYENTYTQVYINSSGYLTFTPDQMYNLQTQLVIPIQPNNVVAGYWAPLSLGDGSSKTGQVYYLSGGNIPNRYFAVEWYEASYNQARHTFEVVLYEDGRIDIGYKSMPQLSSCAVGGIEDSRGRDGLAVGDSCAYYSSGSIYRFTRPAASPRVSIPDPSLSRLVSSGQPAVFHIRGFNTGSSGADTYEISLATGWPVYKIYHAGSGKAPVDTDGDGTPDTGPISPGGYFDLDVLFGTSFAPVGTSGKDYFTVKSSLDPDKSDTIRLDTAVAPSFVAGFRPQTVGQPALLYEQPGGAQLVSTTATSGSDQVVAETAAGNIFTAFTQFYWVNQAKLQGHAEIFYSVYGSSGGLVKDVTRLADLSWAAYSAADQYPSIAAAPDGKVAVTWIRTVSNASDLYTSNVLMQIFNENGAPLTGVINVTSSTVYGSYNLHQHYVREVEVAATGDSQFEVGWNVRASNYSTQPYSSTEDIYLAVYNGAGERVKEPLQLTADTSSTNDYVYYLSLLALGGNRVGVISNVKGINQPCALHLAVINSSGNLVRSDFGIHDNEGGYVTYADAVQLSNGNILVSWGTFTVSYILLDGSSYALLAGPTGLDDIALKNDTYVSMAADAGGHGIITWSGSETQSANEIYYALVDGDGSILTNSMVLYHDDTRIETTNYGGRITSHSVQTTPGIDLGLSGVTVVLGKSGAAAVVPVWITNMGVQTAPSPTLSASLPPGITVTQNPGANCTDTACAWALPDLEFAQAGPAALTVQLPDAQPGSRYDFVFSISAENDALPANNTRTVSVYVSYITHLPLVRR